MHIPFLFISCRSVIRQSDADGFVSTLVKQAGIGKRPAEGTVITEYKKI
jgi:hypothetical protein